VDRPCPSGPVDRTVMAMTDLATADAVAYFAAALAFQTDVSDVHAALDARGAAHDPPDTGGFVLVDSRGIAAWEHGHIPGAIHLPTAEIPARAATLLNPAVPVVTYCWGPGCNGATKAALALARLGYQVKEMIGGIEYWIREGFEVHTATGPVSGPTDPLTAPVGRPADPLAASVARPPLAALMGRLPLAASVARAPLAAPVTGPGCDC
jgi:rhodanese-related sulfurtransferase